LLLLLLWLLLLLLLLLLLPWPGLEGGRLRIEPHLIPKWESLSTATTAATSAADTTASATRSAAVLASCRAEGNRGLLLLLLLLLQLLETPVTWCGGWRLLLLL